MRYKKWPIKLCDTHRVNTIQKAKKKREACADLN